MKIHKGLGMGAGFCLLAIGVSSIFANIQTDKMKENDPMKHHTYDSFEKSVGGFPYTASEARKSHIIENYPRLTLGMSKQQVIKILGEPDIAEEMLPKFAWERPKSHGWLWSYYVYRSKTRGVNSKIDKMVCIFFDINRVTCKIFVENIPGLLELGKRRDPAEIRVIPTKKGTARRGDGAQNIN